MTESLTIVCLCINTAIIVMIWLRIRSIASDLNESVISLEKISDKLKTQYIRCRLNE